MLGKLMKYEWKATRRTFLPLYGAILVVAIVNGIFFRFDNLGAGMIPWIKGIALLAYVGVIVGTMVLTAVVMLQRYYKNILGSEGYLMHTLPVKGWEHIISKGTLASLWMVGSVAVIIISLPLIMMVTEPHLIGDMFSAFFDKNTWKIINGTIGTGNLIGYGVELLILSLATSFMFCMKTYSAMSLGHLVGKHRLLASVAFYLGLDIVERMIFAICMSIGGKIFSNQLESFFHILERENGVGYLHLLFLGGIVIVAIVATVYFFIAKYILDRKLNLE